MVKIKSPLVLDGRGTRTKMCDLFLQMYQTVAYHSYTKESEKKENLPQFNFISQLAYTKASFNSERENNYQKLENLILLTFINLIKSMHSYVGTTLTTSHIQGYPKWKHWRRHCILVAKIIITRND